MSIVIGKNVDFFLTKFTPKAGQIYPQLRTPGLHYSQVTRLHYREATDKQRLGTMGINLHLALCSQHLSYMCTVC